MTSLMDAHSETAEFDNTEAQQIGTEIRVRRKLFQKTLKQLSSETGISIGYLSQIERNISSPSVKSLHAISRALDVNITWFFGSKGDSEAEQYVMRSEQCKELRYESGISDFLLSQHKEAKLELLWCRFEPGSSSGDEPYSHTGEEAGVVISGEFALCIDDRWYLLEVGDSFSFPSSLPHKYKNPGRKTTEVVWVVTPPTY